MAYVRVSSVPELVKQFRDTAMGKITADPQVRPLLSDLYASGLAAFEQIQDRVGIPLDELLAIPQGELCVALVAPEDGRPEVMALLEVGDHLPAAELIIERAEEALAAQGGERSSEMIGDTELVIYQFPGDRQRRLVRFERDGSIVISSDESLVKQLLSVWDAKEEVRTLADNRRFTTIMKRSVGSRDEQPQITWYVDPLTLVQRLTRGNFSAQAGLSIATGLGLDGLKGIGGSIILATEEFDTIMHAHALLEVPRDGVLKMIAFKSADITPEPWVPKDAASYTTLNWEIDKTYEELARLYNTFRGEEAWKDQVLDRISERLQVDLEQDLIEALDGRASFVTWMERPARINSQANLLAFKLKDADKTQRVLDRVTKQFEDRVTSETYGGTSYYRIHFEGRRGGNDNFDEEIARRPTPCAAIVGDYLMATDSEKFLQQVIVTKSDSSLSLSNELDYKLIANKIGRQLGEAKAGMITFNRPEEGMRLLYELATAQSTQTRLANQAENNPFFRALNNAVTKNPLPPFAVIAKYLAPGGAIITDDETGIHYTAFGLRRE
ncbi:MAG: hypothetical protein CMJ64_29775 [Planctomycetaceae bacterium]|nr:hypothetical protein [Planctomycetaceae bacterium]